MQVQFGTDGKRINSTKIPTVSITKTCVLKRPCSIESPVLDLSEFIPQASVAYIPSFGRYYFVTNIESVTNDITRYYLSVDPLASHKNKILTKTVFVERSQSSYSNFLYDEAATHLDDEPGILTQTFSFSNIIDRDTDPTNYGCYILQTIAPGTSGSVGAGTCTYAVTKANMSNLISKIFDTGTYGQNVVSDEIKTYFNPFEYIVSCQWVPIEITALIGENLPTRIKFGWWECPANTATGIEIPMMNVICYADIVLPAALDWTDYNAAWHKMDLYIPGCGTVEIDPIYTGTTIKCYLHFDVLTGSCVAELRTTDSDLICTMAGQLGVDVRLTQLASDATNLMSNAITSPNFDKSISQRSNGQYQSWADVLMEGISGGYKPGFFSGALGTIAAIPVVGNKVTESVKNALQPQTSICGTNGNMTYLLTHLKARLTNRKYSIYETDIISTYGKPCRRNKRLSTLSGYTLCNNASVEIAGATAQEKTAIKNYLEGGFWIE